MIMNNSEYDGVLLVDKPVGITSHDLVHEIRKIVRQKKIGHTGTLDQKAGGLMIICLGRSTKVAQFITDFGKTYEAEICLGIRSKTYDSEGVDAEQQPMDIPHLTDKKIDKLLSDFRGTIKQTVPIYSAVRVNGNRLYNMARQGKKVTPPVREVHIKEIKLIKYEEPHLTIHVACSKGTYIRSIAHDIGVKLGCGAYLSKLVRSSIGEMQLKDSLTLEGVEEAHNNNSLKKHFLPYQQLFNFGGFIMSDQFKNGIINGKNITKKHLIKIDGEFEIGDRVSLKDDKGKILAIGTSEISSDDIENVEFLHKLFKYSRVLN